MLERILNNGTAAENEDLLNRKIRIANLIALISVVVIGFYTPLYFYHSQIAGILSNSSFWLVSLLVFPLLNRHYYRFAFHFHVIAGYCYFIIGTVLYGVETNLHFYMLAMCMIAAVLFDAKKVIRIYLLIGITSFFLLICRSYYYPPLVKVPASLESLERIIGNINLLLLFSIICVFILFFKNGMLRSQRNLQMQKTVIEEKNRDITDSIHYAKRIQTALLPEKTSVENLFPDHFLFYRPKDIVSGDFYWTHSTGEYHFAAVGDCTGHGVPGALMSVLGINLLIETVENRNITDPGEILNELRKGIIYAFDKEGTGSEYKDGMDISIIRFSKKEQTFSYAAANNPIYHFRSGELSELAPQKQPAGYSPLPKPFVSVNGSYGLNDVFVLFTDGFADQFGGARNKKFMYRPFKELLANNLQTETVEILNSSFESWRGLNEQVDDICILGLRM